MGSAAIQLNASQKQAVESRSPQLLVLAGPGTGKTRVIVQRILSLVESGECPEKILAVTFSRKATQEMEERLFDARPDLIDRLQVCTLHSFCIDLVKANAFRIGSNRKLELISEAQTHLFFRQIAYRLPLEHFIKTSYYDPIINELMNFFQDCKDEGLWPEDIIQYATSLSEETEEEKEFKKEWLALADVYNAFQTHCLDRGFIDFGDAILYAVRILEDHPSVRKQIQSQFSDILVDEFQDTNWTQIKLLRLISGENARVCVVGDDDQSIYRFRGASYSAFKFFEEMFPQPEVIELNESFRLPKSVVECSGALIQANGDHRFRPDKKIISCSKVEEPVEVFQFASYEDEGSWVAEQIQKLLNSGTPPNEIAVLIRAHSHAQNFLEEAKRFKIPVQATASEALFDQEIVQDIFAYLKLLANPEDSLSLLRLLDSPFLRLGAEEIFKFCQWARERGGNYLKLIDSVSEAPLKPESIQILIKFKAHVVKAFADGLRTQASGVLEEFYNSENRIEHLLQNDLRSLRALSEFHTQLRSWEMIQEKKELKSIFPILESIAQHQVQLSEDELTEPMGDAVRVLTVHASKGLEFKYVFILSLVGRRFPGNFKSNTWMVSNNIRREDAPTKETHLEEERRLLYVGMTRAKEKLWLTCVDRKGTKASRFLTQDIAPKISESHILKWNTVDQNTNPANLAKKLLRAFERSSEFSSTKLPKRSGERLRLSYTQLEKYQSCPLSYWFAYELRIPMAPAKHMEMGSLLHSCLEDLYKKVQADQTPSLDEFLADYDKKFEERQLKNPELTENEKAVGLNNLKDFYLHQGDFIKPLELEKDFYLKIGEHEIKGKIDRVDLVELPNRVRIIDYKTGKPKSSEKKEDVKMAKESLQLSIYAMAAKECFNWELVDLQLYYLNGNSTLTTSRDQAELETARKDIQMLAKGILDSNFDPQPSQHICKHCDFKHLCPHSAH